MLCGSQASFKIAKVLYKLASYLMHLVLTLPEALLPLSLALALFKLLLLRITS